MRRSSRIASIPDRRRTVPVDDDNDQFVRRSGDESDEFNMPARKRRKAKANTVEEQQGVQMKASRQRVRGRLAALPEMPLDILYEILQNMHPRDLLQVSRTTKTLRSVLMSKSSIWIWNASHAASDLPPVPQGMTVPQFVSLAYDRFCHFCSAPSVNSIIWAARVRCCKKCMCSQENFIPEESLRTFNINIMTRILFLTAFYAILPSIKIRDGRYIRRLCPTVSVRALCADYSCDGMDQQGGEELRGWIAKKRAEQQIIDEHAALCEAWDAERQAGRDEELEAARYARKADILRRLQELGWADEIRRLGPNVLVNHKLVRKPQPLTDKIWQRIKGPLLEYLQDLKTERLAKARRTAFHLRHDVLVEAYRDFLLARPFRVIYPSIGDIAGITEVKRIIEDTPHDEKVTLLALRAILDAIPQSYFDEWRDRCDTALVEVLDSTRRETPATKADLTLATTVFTHNDDWSDLSYPLVLVSDDITRIPWTMDTHGDDFATMLRLKAWSAKQLKTSERQIAQRLVMLAGLDPKTATSEEMDELDPWYFCSSHPNSMAMTWRRALRLTEPHLKFELLDKVDTTRARQIYAKHAILNNVATRCVRCGARFAKSTTLSTHLNEAHDLTTFIVKIDYELSFDDGRMGIVYVPDAKGGIA
ncbi:hypothetical protein BD626DRAFT_466220 [Schizophyllum amplum]|uniref:F-box domain-containing protein n=1 Tax=Schizophyllum amplum TaxID=97359 RepID=A0A550BVH6_9AGAR|nr:hypothetical protein BD626DRAFT_466220 [Auriculariopsis ampla]